MGKPHAKCDDMRNALNTAMTKAETRVDNPCVNTPHPLVLVYAVEKLLWPGTIMVKGYRTAKHIRK